MIIALYSAMIFLNISLMYFDERLVHWLCFVMSIACIFRAAYEYEVLKDRIKALEKKRGIHNETRNV